MQKREALVVSGNPQSILTRNKSRGQLPIAIGRGARGELLDHVSSPVQGGTVRPKTIVYFEWIIFGTLLLDILQTYLDWDQIIAQVSMSHRNSAVALTLTVLIFILVLVATLTLLVSRRRSKIAMWVSIVLFALGLFAVFVQSTTDGLPGSDIILAALENIGQVVAYGLLFTSSARRWMRRENEKLRDVFH